MSLFQGSAALVLLCIMIYTLSRMRGRSLGGVTSHLIWMGLWCLGLYLIIEPESLTRMAHQVGVGRGADFLFYITILMISFSAFFLYLFMRKLEYRQTRIIQHLALKEAPNAEGQGALGQGYSQAKGL